MLVWQRCRYTAAPATVQATAQRGGQSIMPFYPFALKFFWGFLFFFTLPLLVFVHTFAGRWESVTAAGFDVHLSFLCGIHERFASRGNAEWCEDGDYLLNRGRDIKAPVL